MSLAWLWRRPWQMRARWMARCPSLCLCVPTYRWHEVGASDKIGSRRVAAHDDTFITGMPGGRDTRCPVSG